MLVSRKSKKNLSKKRKNGEPSKKTHKYTRKMKGGGVIINDRIKGKYYNIEKTDVIISNHPYGGQIYLLKNEEICNFINNSSHNFNNNDDDLNDFNKAIETEDMILRDELLENVFTIRKKNIEKENLINLPNGVYFRTPKNDTETLINCNVDYPSKFKLPIFDVRENFLYLYKVVSIMQLHMILKNSLNSKYGGIGGADRRLELQHNDRGKMYIGISKDKTDYFFDRVSLPILIIIKIPVEMSYTINLSANFNDDGYMDTYFIGIIPKKYIKIKIGNKLYELTTGTIKSAIKNLKENYEAYQFKKEIIEILTEEQIQSFTPEFIKLFSLEQLKMFSQEQKKMFLPTQLQNLDQEQLNIVKPEQNISNTNFSFETHNY
jgi:hypothetical protein